VKGMVQRHPLVRFGAIHGDGAMGAVVRAVEIVIGFQSDEVRQTRVVGPIRIGERPFVKVLTQRPKEDATVN